MPSLFKSDNGYYIKGNGFLIPFDLVLSEDHSMDSVVTEHPIDGTGTAVATHIHNKLRQGSFEGLVTNWGYNASKSRAPDYNQLTGELKTYYRWDNMPNRAKDTYTALKELWQSRSLVEIILGLEVYKNCVITHIGSRRDSDSGEAQRFSIGFRQVALVTLKKSKLTVGVSKVDTNAYPEDAQAAAPINAGAQ